MHRPARPRALIHVQHLLGIGHFVRARHLAAGLAAAGFDVRLVSGGMPVAGALPPGVELVQLPPIRVADASFTPLCDETLQPIDDAFRARRRERVVAAFDETAPSVVLLETFPFGRRALRFELLPLIERIAEAHPRPRLVASVRDILQRQPNPERERAMLELAGRRFDAVLVHGDARLARFEDSFSPGAPLHLAPVVHYTGFVGVPDTPQGPEGERSEVVISAGGGAVGERLLATALDAQPLSSLADRTWRVLAGPNLPESAFRGLRARGHERLVVERGAADLSRALKNACVSISQAGYNTALEAVASGARAVFVPFAEQGQTEQATRAARWAAHRLAIVVDERELTPAALARAVDQAALREDWGSWNYASDGAQRSAEIVAEMLK